MLAFFSTNIKHETNWLLPWIIPQCMYNWYLIRFNIITWPQYNNLPLNWFINCPTTISCTYGHNFTQPTVNILYFIRFQNLSVSILTKLHYYLRTISPHITIDILCFLNMVTWPHSHRCSCCRLMEELSDCNLMNIKTHIHTAILWGI